MENQLEALPFSQALFLQLVCEVGATEEVGLCQHLRRHTEDRRPVAVGRYILPGVLRPCMVCLRPALMIVGCLGTQANLFRLQTNFLRLIAEMSTCRTTPWIVMGTCVLLSTLDGAYDSGHLGLGVSLRSY